MGCIPTKLHQFIITSFRDFVRTHGNNTARSMHAGNLQKQITSKLESESKMVGVFDRVSSMTTRTLRALKLLRLDRLYSGCFLKLNTATLSLLRVAEPYITWG